MNKKTFSLFEDKKFFEQDFSGYKELLNRIRQALIRKKHCSLENINIGINFDPSISYVYVSLFQAKCKVLRWGSRKETLEDSINRDIQKIIENERFRHFKLRDKNKCRIMIEIVTELHPLDIKDIRTDTFCKNRFEPGITGIKLASIKSNNSIYYMPTDAVVYSHYTLKQVFNHLSKKTGISKLTNKISKRYELMRSNNEYNCALIKSRAVVTYNDKVIPLYRGYPYPVKEVSVEELRSRVIKGVSWAAKQMNYQGKFLYYYDPTTDSIIDHEHPNRDIKNNYYNIIRHGTGVMALLRAYQASNDKKFLRKAGRSIKYTIKNLGEHFCNGKKAYYTFCNDKAKLGGTGVNLATMVIYHVLSGDNKFNNYMEGMVRHLLSRIHESGEFYGYYIHPEYNEGKPLLELNEKERKELFSFYYPGEALLALGLYHNWIKNIPPDFKEEIKNKSMFAIDWLINVRPEKYADLFSALPSDAWLMQSIEEWTKNKEFLKQEYIDFVFNDALKLISQMYQEGESPYLDYEGALYYFYGEHPYPDGARGEGLISAWYLALKLGRKDIADKILTEGKKLAKSLLYLFHTHESSYAHRIPGKATDSVKLKFTRQWTRIDMIQHVVCYLYRYYNALVLDRQGVSNSEFI